MNKAQEEEEGNVSPETHPHPTPEKKQTDQ